ncbi:MAG: formylglycine-generating enzyme family protein [Candidatus Magnetomorum sp.]|nr:formylglycine-generating enzyme family protein [Candidatus Magnetomorum sp.]
MSQIITNSIGMILVYIPAGSFVMGGDEIAEQADEMERPRHRVTIDRPFYLGRYPVTQAEWLSVMKNNPSHFSGDRHPVEQVSYNDVHEFINQLNTLEKTKAYRLPYEAEWEYAVRAGSQTIYSFGNTTNQLETAAWFRKNSAKSTHPVGKLAPNAWGLYDMHGNVHEWCEDWFDKKYYTVSPQKNPTGPKKGLAKSLRGGDWGSEDWHCRAASRSLGSPDRRGNRLGFRLVHC